jgi:hypothetical protein
MSKNKLLFLFGGVWGGAAGKIFNWYVDSVSGNDANTGATSALALKTFSALAGKTITPGQSVGITGTFRETLTPPSSGSSGSPITYQGYGSGATIIGSHLITVWDQADIPDTPADILSESFNATGYDNAGWTEVLGSGSILDKDSTDIADSAGGATQILKCSTVSPNFYAMTRYDITSAPIVYLSGWVYISSFTLSAGQELRLFDLLDASGNSLLNCKIMHGGTSAYAALDAYVRDAWVAEYPEGAAITTGQWYKIGLKYDNTNLAYDFSINDVSVALGPMAAGNNVTRIKVGDNDNHHQMLTYFDDIRIGSTGYYFPPPPTPLPAGCWKSKISLPPYGIWFLNTDGTISWGNKKDDDMSSCVAEHDWYASNRGYLIIYSPTDPNTRYSGVEGAQKLYGVDAFAQDYITMRNIEVKYCDYFGFRLGNYSKALYCKASYHGWKNVMYGDGFHTQNKTGTEVSHCISHNCGNHGIDVYGDTTVTIQNCIISHNLVYDCYHSMIDIQNNGTGVMDGIQVTYNHVYTTDDWDLNYSGNGIFFRGYTPTKVMGGALCAYNLITKVRGNGIQLSTYNQNVLIYNNTIYGSRVGGMDNEPFGINMSFVGAVTTGTILKNNIVANIGFIGFYVDDAGYSFSAVDHNCWYETAGGTIKYARLLGTDYHFDDFAAYKAAIGGDTHGLWQDPLVVSAIDLHLQAGSPCINAGVNVSLTPDYAGAAVGNPPEIGCYEK